MAFACHNGLVRCIGVAGVSGFDGVCGMTKIWMFLPCLPPPHSANRRIWGRGRGRGRGLDVADWFRANRTE